MSEIKKQKERLFHLYYTNAKFSQNKYKKVSKTILDALNTTSAVKVRNALDLANNLIMNKFKEEPNEIKTLQNNQKIKTILITNKTNIQENERLFSDNVDERKLINPLNIMANKKMWEEAKDNMKLGSNKKNFIRIYTNMGHVDLKPMSFAELENLTDYDVRSKLENDYNIKGDFKIMAIQLTSYK